MINPFVFNTTPSIRFGVGLIKDAGSLIQDSLTVKSALIVTDQGMMATGLVDRLLNALPPAGIEHTLYTDVVADPPESVVHEALDAAKSSGADVIIGFGGGSSLDVAKLAALLAPGHQDLSAAYGVGLAKGPRLPLILIPTTAGTGSEVTPVSIVTTGASEKMGVVSPILLPDMAILDPELTLSVPPHVTAATGIDAMVHAIEAYASASVNNNPISRGIATEALSLMGQSILTAVNQGGDLAARADMSLGSMLAGQAFANSPVAAVHALAYPIGGHFKIPHGLSNTLVLPHVLRFNSVTQPAPYAEIAPYVFPEMADMGVQEAAAAFAEGMAELSEKCGLEQRLRDVGIGEDALPMLAQDAMNQTRLLVNNPREVTEADALAIYRAAW
jgi:alcohol dehydrogenase class IV